MQNQALAKVRIVVEHAIGGLKRYYILRNENRMKKPEENQKLDVAVELYGILKEALPQNVPEIAKK